MNSPDAQKADNGNVQILSFSQSSKSGEETGVHNKGMIQDDEAGDEDDESEETLTPGDLMAFAWQISEGMVSLMLSCVTINIMSHVPSTNLEISNIREKMNIVTEYPLLNFEQ